jgi:uncharacterized protein
MPPDPLPPPPPHPTRYLPQGFLVNGAQVEGAILCLPDAWLMWDVAAFSHITPESLAILDLMAPPPEFLVVGSGAAMQRLPEQLHQQLARRGVAVEVQDTVSGGRGARRGVPGGGGLGCCSSPAPRSPAWVGCLDPGQPTAARVPRAV